MGYTTEFQGEFKLNKVLDENLAHDMLAFADERHEGSTFPGIWCDWVPSKDRTSIVFNGSEKFYNYVEWIKYLIRAFLAPNGFVLNGTVKWRGEDMDDLGRIIVKDNVVSTEKVEF